MMLWSMLTSRSTIHQISRSDFVMFLIFYAVYAQWHNGALPLNCEVGSHGVDDTEIYLENDDTFSKHRAVKNVFFFE